MIRVMFFTAMFAILLLNSSVEGVQCLQGQRVAQDGTEQMNSLVMRECADSSAICHRYDITATVLGATGKNFKSSTIFFLLFIKIAKLNNSNKTISLLVINLRSCKGTYTSNHLRRYSLV